MQREAQKTMPEVGLVAFHNRSSPIEFSTSFLDLMNTTASMSEAEDFGDAVELAAALGRDAAPPAQAEKHVCPYCGLLGPRPEGPCGRCTIEDSPQTRQATKARIGPWYVLQSRNPAAPGMKWSTLIALVKKGQVTARAVVRGPTTHQFWRLASQVKGLSREFNVCYSCGGQIDRTANQCPHCDRLQEPPANLDQLLESREMQRKPEPAVESGGAEFTPLANREPVRPDAGLLTARELAAAFQLDFSPEDGGARLVAPPTSRATKPPIEEKSPEKTSQKDQKASSVATIDALPANRRRPVGRVMMVLTLLGVVGVAAVIWLNPPYQAMAREWLSVGVNTISSQFSSSSGTAPAEGTGANKTAADTTGANASGAAPTGSVPATDKRATDAKPLSANPPPRVVPSTPLDQNLKIPSDPQSILQWVRSVRSAAIDAETAGDYRKAVAQYEQIRKAPREYWPTDLDRRLEDAKLRLK